MLPSRLVMADKAAREPDETKLPAPAQPLPGRRIIWVRAPARRIALTETWTVCAQIGVLGTVKAC